MPQVQRATTGIKTANATTLQSLINNLTVLMAQGKNITASDANQLIATYNSWITHTHTADDLRGIDTFGNVGFYGGGTYAADPSSSAAKNTGGSVFSSQPLVIVANVTEVQAAAQVNAIITNMNTIRSHKHTIFDTTS